MQEQTCALRALSSTDGQEAGCLALPCACDVERDLAVFEERGRHAVQEPSLATRRPRGRRG